MKLRILALRNPSAVFRCRFGEIPPETEVEDNTEPLEEKDPEEQTSADGIPSDMGNKLPAGGRTGNPKTDSFQGYKIPPMY